MFGKGYLICTFTVTVCLVIFTEASRVKPIIRMPFAVRLKVDNNFINYRMPIFSYEYDSDDVEVHRDENASSVRINIKKAKIRFSEGLSQNDQYKQFDLPYGAEFELKTEGTADLSSDHNYVLNCQLTFAEKSDKPINGVPDVVKQAIFNKLPINIDRDLCRTIRV